MSDETDIVRACLVSASMQGARLFRNNVGGAYDARGRYIRYGLAVGSGDCIGWRTLTITPGMVGSRIAQFVSVECKAPTGRESRDQRQWREVVNAYGGLAVVVRDAGDLIL